ncbi:hypothetical protein JG687_00015822 [Phytophthora cactorum]|uniref:Uncharacterized protein n=1 Tax=Phytophthora cactorum TaxID=29920 RepID=A0A329SJT2_9STRA|nr:hypothetical protein PC120_g22909 [Phytophthora cactorum]KAG4040693.1 hypothetical protein PC123_g23772 [Phytophthora cactorum]KAG6947872.1 hypothetical protein JG687_00015822 [Phytophthora cactorum]RAW37077.1 hypothetical protein PC110_g6665 [Phytophthora cactorum]
MTTLATATYSAITPASSTVITSASSSGLVGVATSFAAHSARWTLTLNPQNHKQSWVALHNGSNHNTNLVQARQGQRDFGRALVLQISRWSVMGGSLATLLCCW